MRWKIFRRYWNKATCLRVINTWNNEIGKSNEECRANYAGSKTITEPTDQEFIKMEDRWPTWWPCLEEGVSGRQWPASGAWWPSPWFPCRWGEYLAQIAKIVKKCEIFSLSFMLYTLLFCTPVLYCTELVYPNILPALSSSSSATSAASPVTQKRRSLVYHSMYSCSVKYSTCVQNRFVSPGLSLDRCKVWDILVPRIRLGSSSSKLFSTPGCKWPITITIIPVL